MIIIILVYDLYLYAGTGVQVPRERTFMRSRNDVNNTQGVHLTGVFYRRERVIKSNNEYPCTRTIHIVSNSHNYDG